MELEIKYKKVYEDQDCAFVGGPDRVVSPKPVWEPFNTAAIMCCSRDYVLDLFNRPIDVIIKQDGVLISNNKEMRNYFRKRGDKVMDLASIAPNSKTISEVGFI